MKHILLIGMLSLSVNAFACPNLTGEWQCSDSEGEKWTETIVSNGNRFEIIYDKGTPDQKSEILIADGRKTTESSSVNGHVNSFFNTLSEQALNMLSKEKQAMFLIGIKAFQGKVSEYFSGEGSYTCQGNSLKGTYAFKGSMSLPLVLSAEGKAVGELVDKLEGNERHGVVTIKGTVVGKPASISLWNDLPPMNEKLDKNITMNCTKK